MGLSAAIQVGILITGPQVLESTRRIDTVVLDKTGTVTTGQMQVHAITTADATEDEVWRLVGAMAASMVVVGMAVLPTGQVEMTFVVVGKDQVVGNRRRMGFRNCSP